MTSLPFPSGPPRAAPRRGFTRRQWRIAAAAMAAFGLGMLALLHFPLFATGDPFVAPAGLAVAAVWGGTLARRLGRTPSRLNLVRKLVLVSLPVAVGVLGAAHLANAALDGGRPSEWFYAVQAMQSAGRHGMDALLVPRGPGAGGPPLTVRADMVGGPGTPVGTPLVIEVRPGRLGQPWIAGIRRATGP